MATTGRQLVSVALRFRSPWCERSGRAWRGGATTTTWQFGRDVGAEPAEDGSGTTRLEAVLFLANEPLTSRRLAQLASLEDGTQARTLIGRLNKTYHASARAFRVEEVAGGYQLRTRPEFSRWIRRMVGAPPEIRMSGPALETLAVVAYRQPVLRAEIEAIRGVQCGEILRQLMERGMVRITGRAQELGRPILYGTTRNFLQVFGLRSLDELPRASMLRKSESDVDEKFLDPQLDEAYHAENDEEDEDETAEDETEDDEEDEDETDGDEIDDDDEE